MGKYTTLSHQISKTAFFLSLIGVFLIVLNLGFNQTSNVVSASILFYFIVLIASIIATVFRFFNTEKKTKKTVIFVDILAILYSFWVGIEHFSEVNIIDFEHVFFDDFFLKLGVFITFIREFSEVRFNYKSTLLNPAQLFAISFILVIIAGSLLLMLPNATYEGISFLDALFTSTSAVCVTGLIVVDTATYFTEVGQIIIMILIQLGGLGILTFASYFSYFFKGGSTYDNQMVLSDVTSSNKIGKVFSTLKNILIITFLIELFSALLIFLSVNLSDFESVSDQIFFSVFHAVSAFCNAGFSTLSNSIYEDGFRFNYGLQSVVMLTFIFGGLGFPIVVNIVNYLKYKVKLLYGKLKHQDNYKPWVLNMNSRITLATTLSISAIAFIAFYILEYNNTLAEHSGLGKIITAFFGATTPRTAGFNSVDTSALSFPTIMLVFLLMWIGASPTSTGGGIKTSTFAIATLNIISLARGKNKIEVFKREIADVSVRRAFGIISLSLIAIGFSTILISATDPEKKLIDIAFECFSAYSTVGLSLGITGDLSDLGKLVIIGTMFVGRVTLLTVIIALFKKAKRKHYQYPSEEITMN